LCGEAYYKIHLKTAKQWEGLWNAILESINELNDEMGVKYKYLDQKINNLVSTQTTKPIANTKFYPRVLNKTNISFTDEETKLLNK